MRHLLEEAFSNLMEKRETLGDKINSAHEKHEDNPEHFPEGYGPHIKAAKRAAEEGRHWAAKQHWRHAESLRPNGTPGDSARRQDKLNKELGKLGVKDPNDVNQLVAAGRRWMPPPKNS